MQNKLILCYHRVTPESSGGRSLLAVKLSNFKRQVNSIISSKRVVSIDELLHSEESGLVALTFDDGYADNLLHALPFLEAKEVPATFFITAGFINKQLLFLPDTLDLAFSYDPGGKELGHFLSEIGIAIGPGFDYWKALDLISALEESTYWRVIEWLSVKYGTQLIETDHTRRPLTAEELSSLFQSRFSQIGSHCWTHRRMSSLNIADSNLDISRGLLSLKELIPGWIPKYFAYPFGQPTDFLVENETTVRDLNLISFTTTPTGYRNHTNHQIPRLCVQDWPLWKFKLICKVSIVFSNHQELLHSLLKIRRNISKLILPGN